MPVIMMRRFNALTDAEKSKFADEAIHSLIAWTQGRVPTEHFSRLSKDSRLSLKLRGLFAAMAGLDRERLGRFCDKLVESNPAVD